MKVLIEACVDCVESARAAERGGARRLELCANLAVGGTTPSAALISSVKARVRIPVVVMIRPRGGSFVCHPDEVEQMLRDIDMARTLKADGLVMGVLKPNGEVDALLTRQLVAAASGTPVAFHRAFDAVPNQAAALDALIEAGIVRVLTSGGAETALTGAGALADLVDQAGSRITIMAGGKVRGVNVRAIVAASGVSEIHARCELDQRQIRGIADALALGR
jgi:copper homeostasis protein